MDRRSFLASVAALPALPHLPKLPEPPDEIDRIIDAVERNSEESRYGPLPFKIPDECLDEVNKRAAARGLGWTIVVN